MPRDAARKRRLRTDFSAAIRAACRLACSAGLRCAALGVVLGLSACATLRSPVPTQLAGSLQELVPHADRDHFVYLWQRTDDNGQVDAGVQVEHLTALGQTGEFELTLREDGVAVGRTRLRDDGHALLLLSEELGPRLRLSYDPPLPQLEMPLFAGEHRASATAEVTRLSDNQHVGSMQVTQVTRASAGPAIHSPLGNFRNTVSVETVRSLDTPEGIIELRTVVVLVPGIGEIRSNGAASGATAVHRELACATIGGRSLGNCRDLNARVQELRKADSPTVP